MCVCVCVRDGDRETERQREMVGRCCLRGVTHLTIVTHYRMLNGSLLTCACTQTHKLIVTGEDMKEPHEGKSRHTERNTSAPRTRTPLVLWSQLSEMARCSAHWVGAYITPVHTSFLCRLTRWTKACHFFLSLSCNNRWEGGQDSTGSALLTLKDGATEGGCTPSLCKQHNTSSLSLNRMHRSLATEVSVRK